MHNENYISKFSKTIYNLERREYWIVQAPAMQVAGGFPLLTKNSTQVY